MTSEVAHILILGTGGTIAGTAAGAADTVGYRAAQLGVAALVAAVPPLAAHALHTEQLAQVDSKDMHPALWLRLAARVEAALADARVQGIVVTHGTDTLEETAWFLHRVLAPAKPVVLTAAMRPATAIDADGPRNLLDAVTVAGHPGAFGVMGVLAGTVHAAADLRKRHTLRPDAFDGGDAGPLARLEAGRLRQLRPWPAGDGLGMAGELPAGPGADAEWPWVAIVTSHAGADGRDVRALVAAGVQGLVVAGTGHGTVGAGLAAALREAMAAGVAVRRASRCADGPVLEGGADDDLPAAGHRSPAQARVDLLLALRHRHAAAIRRDQA